MRLFVHLVLVFALSGAAGAQSILVHPFESEGSLLGTVVADRIAEALSDRAEFVIGPAAAPSLVPPVLFGDGFVGPLAVLEPGGIARLHGAMLLRAGLGVDLAASGRVVSDAEGLRLELVAASAGGGTLATTLRAPEDEPDELARRGAALLALRAGVPLPLAPRPIDMAGADDALGRMITLLAGGFADEADALFDAAEEAGSTTPRLIALAEDLSAVREGRPAADPALAASLALTVLADDERTMAYMETLAEAGVPAGHAWIGAIAASVNDLERADAAYERAARGYAFGEAARVAYRRAYAREGSGAELADLADAEDPAALVVAALLHELEGDPEGEARALASLATAAPTFPWSFERRSYLAFDAGDGLAAARALAVAVELEPESDLYWTNLGWAWYLLGFWDRSEEASERAVELAPDAPIAGYNLGLVRARFGRLDEAMEAYEPALAADPEVDDEAVLDVEEALEARPSEAALHYVLGRLYEAEGRRTEAASAYDAFLELGGWGEPFDERASARYEALSAPPPPLEIAGPVEARLGGAPVDGWRPGDPVALRFEVITPGEALPETLDARAEVLPEAGGASVVSSEATIEVPGDAIGYVVEELAFELPSSLEPGRYTVRVRVQGFEDQVAEATLSIEVSGEPQVLRRLIGRGVVLTSLQAGRPLFGAGDAERSRVVEDRLVDELRAAVTAAEEVLPEVDAGRFAGLTGGEAFERSDVGDVRDFLQFLLNEGLADVRLTFVDAYAQWLMDGAPAP